MIVLVLVMLGEVKIGNILFETTAEKTDLAWQKAGQPIMSNIHFHQLHLPNSSPKNTFTFFDNIFNCSNVKLTDWWIDAGTPDRILELENQLF